MTLQTNAKLEENKTNLDCRSESQFQYWGESPHAMESPLAPTM